MAESKVQPCNHTILRPQVLVPPEDAEMIRKVHRILKAGKNVEIRRDPLGKPKVLRVSREIEQ